MGFWFVIPLVSVNLMSKMQSSSIGPSVPERRRGCLSREMFWLDVSDGFVVSCATRNSFFIVWASVACVPVVRFCVADCMGVE